jgi:hypothetical protein
MTDEQNPGPGDQSVTPGGADWKTTLAGDNADVLKSLEPYKVPTDFLTAFQTTNKELTELRASPALDWRKAVSGGDESAAKLLERYTTPDAFGKAHLEAVKKISAGEFAKPLPADAKPEQVAEWRKANGIPEKPDAYFEKLPNGRVIGADDKPMFDEVAQRLHAKNAPPELVHELVDWYYGMADKESATLTETDRAHSQAFEDTMRQEWGADYRANDNHLKNFMEGMSPDLKKAFDGFGPDGKKLMHNPEVVKWLANIAREFNPVGMVTPGGNESQMMSIEAELAKLKKMSGNQHSEYWKGPMADQHQKRMTQLLGAKEQLSRRAS